MSKIHENKDRSPEVKQEHNPLKKKSKDCSFSAKITAIKEQIAAGKYNSDEVLDDLADVISNTLFKNV